ncbi:hypothetical protein [Pectinatus sottacetonis]|uniref:hypothetical protein n=1 Tax=Pectinatus sottacetonis TaxID=1002795 RepID=UPI0018C4F687|nr:hypothetical protein [Pectinatus sottacetonis]
MDKTFRVAVNYYCLEDYSDVGYIEYYIKEKKADVFLKSEQAVKSVKDFFSKNLTMQVPHKTMHDFTSITIKPLENLENFKLALTRLWENTNVYVDWSRPVDYVIKHMSK